MNKKIILILLIFFIGGVLSMFGGFVFYRDTQKFLQEAQKTTGVVVELVLDRSSDVYYPIIQFSTSENKIFEFKSQSGSKPPQNKVGDEIDIYYNPSDPYSAKIASFGSIWLGALIFLFMGILFTVIPLLFLIGVFKSSQNKKRLLQNGRRISTQFLKVEINHSVAVDKRNPYNIISQWQDPESRAMHVFKSENIWYNPENYVNKKDIDVLIDPKNYKKYYMDITFLPELK